MVRAGNQELVAAAGLGAAGRNAAREREDAAWRGPHGIRSPLGRFNRGVFAGGEEPQIASHDAVAIAEPAINDELASHGGNHPDVAAETHVARLVPVAKESDLAAKLIVRLGIKQVEAPRS